MFESGEYISDYESETSSQHGDGSITSDIGKSDVNPLKDPELISKPSSKAQFPAYANAKAVLDNEQRRAHNAAVRHQLLSLDAFDRHRKLVNDYLQYYGGSWEHFQRDTSNDKRDIDVIREHGRFLWSEKDEPTSWSERLAKRYWDKLFKEYCLVDVSRYRENKFGMRWRLEKEVICGKGQFTCGNIRCSAGSDSHLRSWEVNFSYKEKGEKRNALVKLRLCPICSDKLNYRYKRREVLPDDHLVKHIESTSMERKTELRTEESTDHTESGEPDSKRFCGSSETGTASVLSSSADVSIWRDLRATGASDAAGPAKTQEEEFDDYFSDMLL